MRKRLRLALLTLAAVALGAGRAAAAEARQPADWMADPRTGCKVWDPLPEPTESVRWSGACVDGFASGPGVTEWLENGAVTERTEAPRAKGHLEGKGVQTLVNGDRFEGSWKDDRKDGFGTYVSVDGWTYAGGFKQDLFEGVGVMTDRRGRYEGGWQAGQRNGQGTYSGADGSRFSGLWVNGEPVGGPRLAL